jgi:hypothetical protein
MLTRVHDHEVALVHDLGGLWLGVDCMQAHHVAGWLVHTNRTISLSAVPGCVSNENASARG